VTRTVLTGFALAGVVAALAGCGGSSKNSAGEQLVQKEATLYQIDQIERTWHKAASTHDVSRMMSLWAPGAVFNIATNTYTGKAQIRQFFATQNKAFQPGTDWVADTPSFKMRTTVNGDKGTLYFECDYIDAKTLKVMEVVAVDHNVQKIKGKWLIVSSSAASPVLGP
jgi:SnoaL-like domain